MALFRVRFLVHYASYNAGEQPFLRQNDAQAAIDAGVAGPVDTLPSTVVHVVKGPAKAMIRDALAREIITGEADRLEYTSQAALQ